METDLLLDRVAQGESSAVATLLTRHERRLRRMVNLRFDPRLAARLDPSDIVQDTLEEAHRRLPDYAASRPIPFYPWLRGIAWDKLIEMTRRHIEAQRRSVRREVDQLDLSGDSQMILVDRMMAISDTPSEQAIRQEVRARVRQALKVLPFASVLDDRQLQRFQREALAAAHLKHPHIVGVHSVGCQRGVHYYAMEYIEGRTLEQVVRDLKGSLGPGESAGARDRAQPLSQALVSGRLAQSADPAGGNGPSTDSSSEPSSPGPSSPGTPSADTRPELQEGPYPRSIRSVAARSFTPWPGSASRPPGRSITPTKWASSTGTSNRRTSWSTPRGISRSPTSAWR